MSVVLGSGGARGLAHIGVLKALEENRISISMVVGTSIGALIGGLYASGIEVAELETLAWGVDRVTVAKTMMPKFSSAGLIDNNRVYDFIRRLVGSQKIEQLRTPFAAVATDFVTGKEIVFTKGPLADAILASISIPMIFQPVFLNDRLLLDGGLSNPLPVSVALGMIRRGEKILAVNVSPDPERITKTFQAKKTMETRNVLKEIPSLVTDALSGHKRPAPPDRSRSEERAAGAVQAISPTLVNVFLQSMTITSNNLLVEHLRSSRPSVLLSPQIEEYEMLEFHKGREITQRGYDAAINEMDQICALLSPDK